MVASKASATSCRACWYSACCASAILFQTAIVMGIETLIPLGDLTLILTRNGPADVEHILVHGLTAVYMVIVTVMLLRYGRRTNNPKTT